jgi:hypothetical protein
MDMQTYAQELLRFVPHNTYPFNIFSEFWSSWPFFGTTIIRHIGRLLDYDGAPNDFAFGTGFCNLFLLP